MASVLGYMTRSINRPIDSKINILMINKDEYFQYSLAKTGHNIFVLSDNFLRQWDTRIRPIPSNVRFIRDHLDIDLNIDMIICQDRMTQYNVLSPLSKKLSCPIIMAENHLAYPGTNQFHIEALSDQKYNLNIFNFEFVANSWGFGKNDKDVSIIPPGVDTNYFNGWECINGPPVTVVREYIEKEKATGFDLFKTLSKIVKIKCFGPSKNVSMEVPSYDNLLKIYQKASCYINTSAWKPCPMSVLEAMSVGCPIVTTSSGVIPKIISNANNGFVTNDIKEMCENINILTNNKTLATEVGRAARNTIVRDFNEIDFIDRWNKTLNSVVGQPSKLITG